MLLLYSVEIELSLLSNVIRLGRSSMFKLGLKAKCFQSLVGYQSFLIADRVY